MLEAQQETIQDALNVKKTKVAIENNLINCEAGIAFLEDMTILLENTLPQERIQWVIISVRLKEGLMK